jgi:phosphate transport system ATP-binding protein
MAYDVKDALGNGAAPEKQGEKIRIEGLNLFYGAFKALKEINITIPQNDIVAFIGPSGLGMVFQKPNPFPMSVFDNVAYGPRSHGIRARPCPCACAAKSS